MIVRIISNDEKNWIPSLDIILDIIKTAGLEINNDSDKFIIKETIDNGIKRSKVDPISTIRFKFNFKSPSGKDPILCNARILKDRTDNDKYTSTIIFNAKSSEISDILFKDFDYTVKE